MKRTTILSRRSALRILGAGLASTALTACDFRITPTLAPATETSAPPTPQDQPPVISATNLSRLAEQSLRVPELVERFIWPSSDAPLPAAFSTRPELLLQGGASLLPIQLNPLGLGQPYALPLNGARALAFAPDGSSMTLQEPSRTALFRLDGTLLRELPQPAVSYGASYSRDGRYLVVTSADVFEASLYDLAGDPSAPPVVLSGFQTAAPVYSVSVAPGGQTIVWHARATLHLQDVASGQMGTRLSYEDFINSMAFSPDGSKLAFDVFGSLYLYAIPDGRELTRIALTEPVNALDWSPDGKLLAAGHGRGLKIWYGPNLTSLFSQPGVSVSIIRIGFSPAGRYIASTHEDNVFGVWAVS